MTLRSVSPMLSLFAIPAIVGVIAVNQLMSLDGLGQTSVGQPIALQPQMTPKKLVPSVLKAEPVATAIEIQTEQEHYNSTLSQIQEGDWLTQQGQFQAAKTAYHQALSQTQNAELAATATDRLHQLHRQLALKPVAKPVVKLALKPIVESEPKPVVRQDVKPSIKLANKPVREFIPELTINLTVNPIANPTVKPIVNHSAADRLPISQPASAASPELGQSPSSGTSLPSQTIGAKSLQ